MEVHFKQNWFDGFNFIPRSVRPDDLRTVPGVKRHLLPKTATIVKDDHVAVAAEVDAEKVPASPPIDPKVGVSPREFDDERKALDAEQKKIEDALAKQAEIERLEKEDTLAKQEEDRRKRAERLARQIEREAAAGIAGKK